MRGATIPNLSVVIPSYNTAQMTLRCCRAAREAAEVIVVDDGSSDGTAALLAAENVRVIRLEKNSGFAAAANRGVAAARGSIILLLNSDAVVQPGALQALLAAFDADPRLGIAGARLLNPDRSPQWSGGRTPTLPWMIGVVSGAGHLARFFRRRRDEQREVDWVSGAAMAVRRAAWSDLTDRYLFYCQDIDLCLTARAAGWRVRVVEEARVVHDLGGTIAGGSAERLWPDLLTWGRGHYGKRWATFARIVLLGVAAPRVAVQPALRRAFTALRKS
jgi:GT2 family glycosyltransferase